MRVRLLQPVTFGPGALLGLSAEQARPRAALLVQRDDGLYIAGGAVQFKRGESLEIDDLPRGLEAHVQRLDEAQPIAAPAPAAQEPKAPAAPRAAKPKRER